MSVSVAEIEGDDFPIASEFRDADPRDPKRISACPMLLFRDLQW